MITSDQRLGTILVVDDDGDTVDMVSEYFTANAFDVVKARRGRDALTLADAARFDVVLLDIMMPGMSGVEVLEHLCRRWPGLPVIMLSGIADVEQAKATLKLGAFDYVSKPIFWDQLYRCVVAALTKARARAFLPGGDASG